MEKAVEPVGGLSKVNSVTASSTVSSNVCPSDKSTTTSPLEISSVCTFSEYVLNLTDPSKSTSALGEPVPKPTFPLLVDRAVPTTILVAVMIPVRISPDELFIL